MRLLSDLAPYPDLSGHCEYTARDYVQDGLVAMWDGIENAGWGVHVDSGNSWTDLVGGVAYSGSVGWNSDSAKFNGTGDYLISDAFIPDESMVTCEFVIRPESVSGSAFVASQSTGGGMGRQRQSIFIQSGRVNFGSSIAGGRAVSAEYSRHSYSAVYTDSRYYVDSTPVDTVAAVDYWGCTKASIGCNFNNVKRNLFKGDIHSIRIYSRALTADEIAHNYEVDNARFHIGEEPLAGRRLMEVGAKEAVPLKAEFPSSSTSRSRNLLALKAINWRASGPPTPPVPWDYEVEYIQSNGTDYVDTLLNSTDANGELSISAYVGSTGTSGRSFYWGYDQNYNTYFERNGTSLGTNPTYINASTFISSEMTLVDWTQTPSGLTIDINHGIGTHFDNTSYPGMPVNRTITLFKLGTSYGNGSTLRIGRVSISMGGIKRAEMVPCVIGSDLCFYDTVREIKFVLPTTFAAGPRI